MSLKRNDIKKIVCKIIENSTDEIMFSRSFQRRENSLNYIRRIGTAKQTIVMDFASNPSYHPGALAHIYPRMVIFYPEVNALVAEMTKGIWWFEELTDLTINQPIQLYTKSERWMLMKEMEGEDIGQKIRDFLEEHTLPLLEDLKDIQGFLKLFEQQDKRLIWGEVAYMFVAGAYVQQGEVEKGYAVIEKRFGKLGVKRQYASVFQYFEEKMRTLNG